MFQLSHSHSPGAPHHLHTSGAPHLHTVDSTDKSQVTDRRRPTRAPRLRRRRAQSDCSFCRHRSDPPSSHLLHSPTSSHLLRDPPSSHRRLHWQSSSGACRAPRLRRRRAQSDCSFCRLARPTVITSGAPHRHHTSCVPHSLHTVDSTVRRRPARAPRLLCAPLRT